MKAELTPKLIVVMLTALISAVNVEKALIAAPPVKAPSGELVSPARLEKLSRAYLGTPYVLDALGEGSGPDKDPLFTRKCVDCQTLVEQVMAEALAPGVGGLERAGRIIRYHGEKVSLENRYHYCIPDWLVNPWPAADITAQVGGKGVVPFERRIDLPAFLAGRGADPKQSPVAGARTVNAVYIPRDQVAALPAEKLHGTIAIWVLNKPAIVAGHCGFLFKQGDGVVLRHASSRKKQVIDQPISDYVQNAPKSTLGLIVLRPTVSGLNR